MKFYIPTAPFHTYLRGVKHSYNPAHVDRATGLRGYPESAVPKELRGNFTVVDVAVEGSTEAPIEQATAAPGEKRATKPRSATVGAAPVGVTTKPTR